MSSPTSDSGVANQHLDVVPAALRGAAGTFDADANTLLEAAGALRAHLDGLGVPWGSDDVGARFGAAYQPAAESVLTNLSSLGLGLDRIGAALVATANHYEATESDMANTFIDTTSALDMPSTDSPALPPGGEPGEAPTGEWQPTPTTEWREIAPGEWEEIPTGEWQGIPTEQWAARTP